MKKCLEQSAEPVVGRAFDLAQRYFDLRAFFVIALTLPSLLALRWMTYGYEASRQGVIPQIVEELKVVKQQLEAAASAGRLRCQPVVHVYGGQPHQINAPPTADLEEGRRRYEASRKQINGLIDRLKSAAPGGFTLDDVADIKRDHRPLYNSFVQVFHWAHGSSLPGQPYLPLSLPNYVETAQRYNDRFDKELLAELEACKVVPWQIAVRTW